jgi:endoglucanase
MKVIFYSSFKSYLLLILFLVFACNKENGNTNSENQIAFLHASGKKIVDQDNNEVLLRGVNLGQWLLMEGFMSGSNGNMTQLDMKVKLRSSGVSETEIEQLFEKWRSNFIRKTDIEFIASRGFNCIRVPLHYELFLTSEQRAFRTKVAYSSSTQKASAYELYKSNLNNWVNQNTLAVDESLDGFKIIDSLVSWCKEKKIYLILDMHAVPGTAGYNSPITDQVFSGKDFFADVRNQKALIAIWGSIAKRYKNENLIAMYDLINEPHGLNDQEMGILFRVKNEIVNSFRSLGNNKLIIIQGTEFGNQYKINNGTNSLFPSDFDHSENLVYSIHRYRLPNNQTEKNPWGQQNHIAYLADAIQFQNTYNVPLFVGETGLDNDYERLKGNFDALKSLGIGWTLWSLKYHTDEGSKRSPIDITGNNPWDDINQWKDGTLFENIRIENCFINTEPAYWQAVTPSN